LFLDHETIGPWKLAPTRLSAPFDDLILRVSM
jgi:hypothetical protein